MSLFSFAIWLGRAVRRESTGQDGQGCCGSSQPGDRQGCRRSLHPKNNPGTEVALMPRWVSMGPVLTVFASWPWFGHFLLSQSRAQD